MLNEPTPCCGFQLMKIYKLTIVMLNQRKINEKLEILTIIGIYNC